jgi:hypothetical protein
VHLLEIENLQIVVSSGTGSRPRLIPTNCCMGRLLIRCASLQHIAR